MPDILRAETLRYLGYKKNAEVSPDIAQSIEACLAELIDRTSPHAVHRIFGLEFSGENRLTIGGIEIQSRALTRHLNGCDEAVLFAATLGPQADFLIQRESRADMSRAVIMQACAAAYIESYCDAIENEIRAQLGEKKKLTRRFSPGYGDFSITHQPDILDILDCPKRIGLTATESLMLAPTKSVTAVIGISENIICESRAGCAACPDQNCPYRKDDEV